MRTVGQFVTDDPKQLSTQLSQLEQNVVKETADIRLSREPRALDVIELSATGPVMTLTIGQAARLDSRVGAVTFNLSPPSDGLPGEFILFQAKGSNGFVVNGIGANVNNAANAAVTPSTQVVFRFFFDGKDYWV